MVRKLILAVLVSVLTMSCVNASDSNSDPEIPLSILEVISGRADNALMRVILFNTEIDPKMYVELIKTPKLALIQRKKITSIKLDNETLEFAKAGTVLLENLSIHDDRLSFSVFFQYEGRHGDYNALCYIKAENQALSDPICKQAE